MKSIVRSLIRSTVKSIVRSIMKSIVKSTEGWVMRSMVKPTDKKINQKPGKLGTPQPPKSARNTELGTRGPGNKTPGTQNRQPGNQAAHRNRAGPFAKSFNLR
eukprot:1576984-Pyramimonas_sp.AAC.1